MSIRSKALALGAGLTLAGGLALTAGAAQASTFNCLLSNGCGALTGVNAAGDPVAVDAKYQNPSEIAIGYPNYSWDDATNTAFVSHEQRSYTPQSYADTDLFALSASDSCTVTVTATGTPVANTGTSCHYAIGTFGASIAPTPGQTGTLTATVDSSLPISGPSLTSVLPGNLGSLLGGPTPVASTDDFTSVVNLGDANSGTYGGQSITLTGTNGVDTISVTVTFILKVDANHQFNPGTSSKFQTIVFAKNGDWSSQCLTAVGSGKLRYEPCTLGNDPSQRWYAYLNGSGPAVNIYPGSSYSFRNGATGQYLEDASTSNPAIPQSDYADSILPGGRQLDANGPSSALWSLQA